MSTDFNELQELGIKFVIYLGVIFTDYCSMIP